MEEYTGKFDTNTPALEIPDQLKGLLADPPLLEGEHPELYGGLLTAVIDERCGAAFRKIFLRSV